MSQPPLSQGIRRLEQALGARLFDRGAGTRLTTAGRDLIPRATLLVRTAAEIVEAPLTGPNALRLGVVPQAPATLVASFAAALRRSADDHEVTVERHGSLELVRRVRDGRLRSRRCRASGRSGRRRRRPHGGPAASVDPGPGRAPAGRAAIGAAHRVARHRARRNAAGGQPCCLRPAGRGCNFRRSRNQQRRRRRRRRGVARRGERTCCRADCQLVGTRRRSRLRPARGVGQSAAAPAAADRTGARRPVLIRRGRLRSHGRSGYGACLTTGSDRYLPTQGCAVGCTRDPLPAAGPTSPSMPIRRYRSRRSSSSWCWWHSHERLTPVTWTRWRARRCARPAAPEEARASRRCVTPSHCPGATRSSRW